ncbi:AMP-dependent synthetase and ligase [Geobacter metallireducens RCH3]|uniref:acetate--CoA ligase n=1 Tax=Geobacter metallireducens (strain ATCC 53774 / DSM 7210 / GS-15) TaxID=269799 RepID=Q39T59_GEOMG|nr:AMP-binding protein [Geobacter metallireducens]ABB32565.1 acetate--coenzyme A ligase [Geobacter metallireducens GS-15]EHP86408.1 AMP-dependent synthetase and ligase [Geobacter metallireducens RCH3]
MLIENGQYNIGDICTSRQCRLGRGDRVAMRWLTPGMERRDYTFNELDGLSGRFANVLASLGVGAGEVFFTYLPKQPEQFVAFLGALKLTAVAGTLFSNFGEEALLDRLADARACGIITKKSLLRKIIRIRPQLPDLRFIILVDSDDHQADGIFSYSRLMAEASPAFVTPLTPADAPSVLHYTSGSTGKPKGVLHRHGAVTMINSTAQLVLGLREDDVYWCTADQGWVTGTSYGIIGPWSMGVTQVHFGGGYAAEQWFEILEREEVSVWYTAPTALRMLMREEPLLFARFDLGMLRHICSVGEPLNPEVIHWARRVLAKEVYDTWFQTETGAIMIANRPGIPVKPGSMGKPVDGIEAVVISTEGELLGSGQQGDLCLKPGWASMFSSYLNNAGAYASKFRNGFYCTGDVAYRDTDGYFWFVGRSDDVINTAGHLISPFEIESALIEVHEVAEAGVIGAPDELLYEKVVAFVSLHLGYALTDELQLKIRLHLANKLSSVATPHEIHCLERIPKNKSGKIMRRYLKATYLGQDAGDISTMEE